MHIVLAQIIALTQEVAVIGGHHNHGVLVKAGLFELVDQLTEPAIAHAHQRGVATLQVVHSRSGNIGLGGAGVWRDLEVVAVEPLAAAIEIHVRIGHIERLMRVKGFDHKEEVVVVFVGLEPLACRAERLRRGHILLIRPGTAILLILLAHATVKGLGHVIRLVDARDPRVPLLPAMRVPSIELLQVPLAARAPIMAVIGGDMREGARGAQALR